MAGYWGRLKEECSLPEDEADYENVIGLSFLESRVGQIAIYSSENKLIVEVSTQCDAPSRTEVVWAVFDPAVLEADILRLRDNMLTEIRRAVKEQERAV